MIVIVVAVGMWNLDGSCSIPNSSSYGYDTIKINYIYQYDSSVSDPIVLRLFNLILALSLYTAPYYNFNIRPASWGGEWRGWVVLTCNVYGYIYIIASISI